MRLAVVLAHGEQAPRRRERTRREKSPVSRLLTSLPLRASRISVPLSVAAATSRPSGLNAIEFTQPELTTAVGARRLTFHTRRRGTCAESVAASSSP